MTRSWTRRDFINAVGVATASLATGCAGPEPGPGSAPTIDKREAVFGLLDASTPQAYIPAAFFLHFDPAYHQGPAAVQKHLEYFRYTGMDLIKIQYEIRFPPIPDIVRPSDWANMPLYTEDFYRPQLAVVEELVRQAKHEAPVLITLYSPFMLAGQTTSPELVTEHIKEDPEQVKKGMEVITDSLMGFVKGCIRAGVDGFYHSTQGGESFRFDDHAPFNACIKPFDLAVMEEIDRACDFNILHVCDFHGGYDDLTTYLEYPGHVVNCSLTVGSSEMTPQQASDLFGRPFMGGIERTGVIATGREDDVRMSVEGVLREASERFILGADCTVPSDTPWDNIRTAIATAHANRRTA